MKKKETLIVIIIMGLIIMAFKPLYFPLFSDPYEVSNPTDQSFEKRLISHDSEIYALENYLTNVDPDLGLVEDYKYLYDKFFHTIINQKGFMLDNNITIEDIRSDPSILPHDFKMSNDDLLKIQNIVNKVSPLASESLKETLEIAEEYFELVPLVEYSQLEIFEDSTGKEVILQQNRSLDENQNQEGLQSREAVRKLRDLLKNQTSSNITTVTALDVSLYPNPASLESKIVFNEVISDDLEIGFLDVKGSIISSNTLYVNDSSAFSVLVRDLVDLNSLNKGVYFINIKNGSKITTLKMINNE